MPRPGTNSRVGVVRGSYLFRSGYLYVLCLVRHQGCYRIGCFLGGSPPWSCWHVFDTQRGRQDPSMTIIASRCIFRSSNVSSGVRSLTQGTEAKGRIHPPMKKSVRVLCRYLAATVTPLWSAIIPSVWRLPSRNSILSSCWRCVWHRSSPCIILSLQQLSSDRSVRFPARWSAAADRRS